MKDYLEEIKKLKDYFRENQMFIFDYQESTAILVKRENLELTRRYIHCLEKYETEKKKALDKLIAMTDSFKLLEFIHPFRIEPEADIKYVVFTRKYLRDGFSVWVDSDNTALCFSPAYS